MTPSSSQDHTSDPKALDVNALKDGVQKAFYDRFGETHNQATKKEIGALAPGRVNLIGGHTDYNDGFVLPVTIDRAIVVILRQRTDETVHLHSLNFEDEVVYSRPKPPFSSLPGWAQYVAGVAHELNEEGIDRGFEGVVYGNVPLGAGLSSSAALEVAMALGLEALFDLSLTPTACARLCQQVEHQYVGVHCGIMDQMASRLGRARHALSLDCRTLEYEHVPLPLKDTSLLIADTRVSRELASSKYNERRAECDECVAFFQQFDEHTKALRDVDMSLAEKHGDDLPSLLHQRCRHVISENRRVVESAQLLKQGNLDAVGTLMNASHQSLREDYEASSPELNVLVETAQTTEGVFGARMTGAGFGGCAVCLVQDAALSNLQNRLTTQYRKQFEKAPALYVISENLESTTFSLE